MQCFRGMDETNATFLPIAAGTILTFLLKASLTVFFIITQPIGKFAQRVSILFGNSKQLSCNLSVLTGNFPLVFKSISQGDRGLYFGPKMIFIPPPPSENYIFPPLATRRFSTTIMAFLP